MSAETILYIILVGIMALGLALFQYRYKAKSKSRSHLLFAFLRFLTLFLIGLLLVNPKFKQVSYVVDKPNLVVLTDNSSSIKHLEQDEAVAGFIKKITDDVALKEKFDIDGYSFGTGLSSSDSLSFDEKQSDISSALQSANEIYKNENTAFILISDGNQTYGNDYQFTSGKIKQPIFPIIVGDTVQYTDLKIRQLNVNKYAYQKNLFPVEVIVTYQGNETVDSRLNIKSRGVTIAGKAISLSATNSSVVVNFNLPANTVGVRTYRAQLEPLAGEKNTINNQKEFAVEVIDQKTKVLVVSDVLHPDLGALKKSINNNEQREATITNTRLRNIDVNDFNLVIVYQPNSRFKAVFEKLNALNKNRWIITGTNTDWRFLNTIQKNYNKRPTGQTEDILASLNPNYSSFIIGNTGFDRYPPLRSRFGDIGFDQSVNTVLWQRIGNVNTENPLLATFEGSGNRREAILLGEGIWKWRSQSFQDNKDFKEFDTFLGKLIQYLASNKRKNRLTVDFEPFYYGSGDIKITSQYFNDNYEVDSRASLSIVLQDSITKETRSIPFLLKNQGYEVDLSSLPPSVYNFSVKVEGKNISRSGTFKILQFDVEKQFLNANVTKLRRVATNTSARAFVINEADLLFGELIRDKRFVGVQKTSEKVIPLIDWKYLLPLIALSLAIEWFLRKYNGLI